MKSFYGQIIKEIIGDRVIFFEPYATKSLKIAFDRLHNFKISKWSMPPDLLEDHFTMLFEVLSLMEVPAAIALPALPYGMWT